MLLLFDRVVDHHYEHGLAGRAGDDHDEGAVKRELDYRVLDGSGVSLHDDHGEGGGLYALLVGLDSGGVRHFRYLEIFRVRTKRAEVRRPKAVGHTEFHQRLFEIELA